MSSHTFEILCPVCRSVVPPDAPGCPNCARTRAREAASAVGPATRSSTQTSTPAAVEAPRPPVPDLRAMPMKEYHRVVRASYRANEGPSAGGGRLRAYLPFVLLMLLLIVGAAVIFGRL